MNAMKELILMGCAFILLGGGNAHADEAKQKQPESPKQAQVGQWRVPSKQPANPFVTKPKAFFRTFQPDPYVQGKLYVRFRQEASPDVRDRITAAVGAKVADRRLERWLPGTLIVSVPAGRERACINQYLDNPDVEYAEPIYIEKPLVIPNDAAWNNNGMYGMRRIRMPDAWDVTTGDPNFVIGVVDSGLYYSHPDLAANVWTNSGEVANNGVDDDGNGYIDDVRGWNVAQGNNDIMDVNSYHGTHVAGTIGAVGNNSGGVVGVNWRCKIMMARTGIEGQSGLSNSVSGVAYLLANGVKISNHSYGSNSFSQTAYNMFLRAQQEGHIAVIAAGNEGENSDINPFYPAAYDLDNIISVARHESNQSLGSSSNYGATTVDLAAPGGGILSTIQSPELFGEKNGTSMASPHVCGAIGLIWSRFPRVTWREMRSRILTGVIHENSYEGKLVSEGRLDVARSMAVFVRYGGVGIEGTKSSPYINIPTALPKVPTGGHLMIRSTSTNWTGRLDKPMYIEGYDGTVTIGRQ
jgi:large repetitive protein